MELDIQVMATAALAELTEKEKAVERGTERGIRLASALAGRLAKAAIPEDTGRTKRRLRVTYSRRGGDFVGRIGVRAPRAHIMRFLELGTKTHGRGGGPLPARRILANVKLSIEPQVPAIIEAAVLTEMLKVI